MNSRKQKVDRWPEFLKYSLIIKATEPIVIGNWKDMRLTSDVQWWLYENVGNTTNSGWHKDQWHPAKPKFLVEVKKFSESRSGAHWYILLKFFDEEDAMAFKLTWL